MVALLAAGDVAAVWSAQVSGSGALGRGRDFLHAATLALGASRGSAEINDLRQCEGSGLFSSAVGVDSGHFGVMASLIAPTIGRARRLGGLQNSGTPPPPPPTGLFFVALGLVGSSPWKN